MNLFGRLGITKLKNVLSIGIRIAYIDIKIHLNLVKKSQSFA